MSSVIQTRRGPPSFLVLWPLPPPFLSTFFLVPVVSSGLCDLGRVASSHSSSTRVDCNLLFMIPAFYNTHVPLLALSLLV